MCLALHGGMTADELVERARAWLQKHPDESEFIERLIAMIDCISTDFDESRSAEKEELLVNAANTLERHQQLKETSDNVHVALKQLEAHQKKLIDAVMKITMFKPPNVTLH